MGDQSPKKKMGKIHLFANKTVSNNDILNENIKIQNDPFGHQLSKIHEKTKEQNDSMSVAQTNSNFQEIKVQDVQMTQSKKSGKVKHVAKKKNLRKIKDNIFGSFDKKMQNDMYKLNDDELNYLSFSGQFTKDMMETHLLSQ